MLGANAVNTKREDAGLLLADTIRKYMSDLDIDNGLQELGYTTSDIPALVQGTLPQVIIIMIMIIIITNKIINNYDNNDNKIIII